MTRDGLAERGFCGFAPFGEPGELSDSEVPTEAGIHVVLRPTASRPEFLPVSTAGHFRGRDPSVAVEVLRAAWVEDAGILYVGKASAGRTGRRGLRKRLDEYRRHGAGQAVGHWGGRYIWQLRDSAALLVAWRPTAEQDPGDAEAGLIAEFMEVHGARPFANRNRGLVRKA
ncbi:hypothetical protein [Streptomyces sp. CB01881]|uniref:hypothetical protein n=1 Tax=Streptomyces sp. CB01881 TaxID=2078691 RepID=UPI001F11E2D2|nr:hypothetical protein [Streptomyces sp. CB01881]